MYAFFTPSQILGFFSILEGSHFLAPLTRFYGMSLDRERHKRKIGSGDAGSSKASGSTEAIDDQESFVNRFKNLYNNQMFSDITLKVGDTLYHAHKLVLVTASEVFE